jgi:predicted DNA binding CopG/RHH family protein
MKTQTPTEMQMQASSTRRISQRGVQRAKAAPVKRTKSICLRLSPDEHQMVREKARAAGMTASALLRDHLGRAQIYNHKQTQVWLATLLSIQKLLLMLAERSVVFRASDAVAAIAYLASIARQLDQFARYESDYAHKIFPSRKRQ